MENFGLLRVSALVFVVSALLSSGGCATTVTTARAENGACQSKVTGLMIAHVFSLPDACRIGE